MQYSQNNLTLRTYLAQNGLLVQKERSEHYYDRFRNRIMFPIRDVRGRVIAFGGRTLENDPAKYLNSPETPIFHKGNELYGLYEARQAHQRLDRVLIVEGYMDVVSLSQHGIHYAVATLGTATSAKHIQKLLRYTPELIFCFDGDRAGRQAAWRALTVALPLMNDGVEARFMFLPEQEDPDSLIQKIGKARFETLITEATPLSEFFFNALKEQIPLLSLDSKARFAKEARSYLDTMPSGLFQQLMIDQLALLIGVGAHETGTLSKLRDNTHALEPMSPPKIPAPLRLALALLLQEPTLVECMEGSNPLQLLEVPGKKLLFELISRYQQNPRLSVGELLAETEDPTKNRMIAELSAWEHQVSTTELKQTFLETLDRLRQLAQEQAISKLISKSKHTPLDEDEKNVLKQLLNNKAGV